MRGFVPTPELVVDQMVALLFRDMKPLATDSVLDPGCGNGQFIAGVLRWCEKNCADVPRIFGVDSDPRRVSEARRRFRGNMEVKIVKQDFLLKVSKPTFEYVICNPPYVSILGLEEPEKAHFRAEFRSARGRFDLYMLFFEKALRVSRPGGTVVFITPEKFGYVKAAHGLRRVLREHHISDLILLREGTFPGLTTYPAITRLKVDGRGETRIKFRSRGSQKVSLPADGSTWRTFLEPPSGASGLKPSKHRLLDFCRRISCGVATGADGLFVLSRNDISPRLASFAWPTVSGRQLAPEAEVVVTSSVMLIPYDRQGTLSEILDLGALGDYLQQPEVKNRLEQRTCVKKKPWYAFHDSLPMGEVLLPKILCKDICEEASFWLDKSGSIIPRHSVYYLVPKRPENLASMVNYLNSTKVREWLRRNSQRAANGYIRIQSSVLKELPVPSSLAREWASSPPTAEVSPIYPPPQSVELGKFAC